MTSGPFDDIPLPPEPTSADAPEFNRTAAMTAERRARITWAADIEPIPVVWAWSEGGAGRIPAGSLSIAAGREGTGKSSWALWLAAHLTRGTLPGSFYGTPRRVLYVAVEDSWAHTLVPRLMAAGADLKMVGRFDVVTTRDEEVTLSLPVDNDLLERAVRQHQAAGVFIDPLMSAMGPSVDTHKERDVRTALDPLAKLADRTGAVVCGIAHFGKGSSTDAASLITGSGAFKNVPRTVFGFAKDDADGGAGRVMTQVKNSLGRDDLPSLSYVIEAQDVAIRGGVTSVGLFAFTGQSDRTVQDILRDGRGTERDEDPSSGRSEAERFIREFLEESGGSAPAKDVTRQAVQAGFKDADITKARFRAKNPPIRSERHGFGKGSTITWTIDAGSPDAIDSATVSTDSTVLTQESVETVAESMTPAVASDEPERDLLASHLAPLRSVAVAPTGRAKTTQCPVCNTATAMGLLGTADGLACRRCVSGFRAQTRCVDCGHPREISRGGRCNECRQAAARRSGAA